MWIRDALTKAFPSVRVVLYGYDTALAKSNSFQTLSDLSSNLSGLLNASGLGSVKPLIFLAHSLGGIILKEALVRDRQIMHRTVGGLMFGVPSRGMETRALMAMVHGQPNENLINALTTGSKDLQTLDDRFFEVALRGRMEMFWAYETRTSPTVVSMHFRTTFKLTLPSE
jgi:hypothetical protein